MFHTIRQLWEILTPLDKKKLSMALIMVIFMALIEAAGVLSIMPFLAVLSNPDVIYQNRLLHKIQILFVINNKNEFIVYLGVISLIIVVFSAFFKIITQYVLNRFISLQRHYFSIRLLKIYLHQKYDFFIQKNTAVLAKNVLFEVDYVVWNIIKPILTIIAYSIVILAMVAILIVYDPLMAISTVTIIFLFYCIVFLWIKKVLTQIGVGFAKANQERYESCQEVLGGIKDVIINHAQQGYLDRFEHNSHVYSKHLATQETLGQIPLHIVETIGYGCLIILALILVKSGNNVSTILPVLGLYGFAAYRMLPAAQNIYRSVTQIKFSENVFHNIENEFKLEQKGQVNPLNQVLNFQSEIRLSGISFAYPNRPDHFILKDFDLIIPKNSSIGLVGKSGSGKSTLMDILLGLLEPQCGKIYIDDMEMTSNNVSSWYQQVGYVPQFIYIADKTIAENIAFGLSLDEIKMDQVINVARQAQLHEFIIDHLPQGYDTLVGERGVMLSGGQRQRLGIARALYKNPEIIFMDEATSALDMDTEQAVNEAIQSLNGQKTMVIIAHRESAVASCDHVLKIGK